VIDPDMDEDIRITVIATGFDSAGVPRRMLRSRSRPDQTQPAQTTQQNSRQQMAPAEMQPASFNPEDLDIPTFLRKRIN
jgi:cell division protein FtsZ